MKTIFQSHWTLYDRCLRMANTLRGLDKPTDEQKSALRDLDLQADEHLRKARLFGDRFLMVVSQ